MQFYAVAINILVKLIQNCTLDFDPDMSNENSFIYTTQIYEVKSKWIAKGEFKNDKNSNIALI